MRRRVWDRVECARSRCLWISARTARSASGLLFKDAPNGEYTQPVSYTHLDVYKRQAFYFHSRQTPKLTEKDTIVLADFANSTGDAVFDLSLIHI